MSEARQKLIRDIDHTKPISQEALNQLFAQARALGDECMDFMVHASDFPNAFILDRAFTVMGAQDHNRAFYKKTASLDIDTYVETDKGKARNDFACLAMNLMAASVDGDRDRQSWILRHTNLTRNVFEECIDAWLVSIENYVELSDISAKHLCNGAFEAKADVDVQLQRIEKAVCCTSPATLYGAARAVAKRRAAIRSLYEKVVEAYSRIVLQTAARTAGTYAQQIDSFQHGSMGLLRAASSYDHCSYIRFPNFARWWISQAILFHLKEQANTVRVPTSIWQQHNTIERERVKLETKHGALTNKELADRLGMAPDQIDNVHLAIRASKIRSLEKILPDQEESQTQTNRSLNNCLIDETPELRQESQEAAEMVVSALSCLTYEEKLMTCLYHGLFDEIPEKPIPRDVDALRKEALRQAS